MLDQLPERNSFVVGFFLSLAGHLLGLGLLLGAVGISQKDIIEPSQVFSVTLEGGEKLGGLSQVPVEEKQQKVLPHQTEQMEAQQPQETVPQEKEPEKKLETPSVVEDVEAKLKEQQKREEAEKKKQDAEKKAAEEKKKLEDKKKQELEEKKKQEEEKKQKEREKKAREEKLRQAISRASRYTGESANAGGDGLGAARVGGTKMGGGTVVSREFLLYLNSLENHIRSGWRWLASTERLVARIEISILPDGTISNASVANSSGNSVFDDSALRAVYKSSPVPTPPADLYEQFRIVRITFDSSK